MVDFCGFKISLINIQALIALSSFILTLFLSRIVAKIMRGELRASHTFLFYLRIVVGFTLTASIYLGLYSFMGKYVLF